MGIWSVLGIEPTQDITAIKRAYARQLKSTRPDQDPEAYQRLREAFESAKRGEQFWLFGDAVTFSGSEQSPADVSSLPLPVGFESPEIINETFIQQLQVHDKASETVALLLESETAGLHCLTECLSGDLLQNLTFREMFSQQLAWELAEREGLYPELLEKVAALMEWEIERYQPDGISAYQLQAMHQQIENTAASRYWASMAREYQGSALNRLQLKLLTVEGEKLPGWTRLVPNFVSSLNEKINDIRLRFPSLLPRVNTRLLNTLAETRLVLRWGTVFLTVFWLLLIFAGTRELPQPGLTRVVLIMIIGLYIHGYGYLERKLRHRTRWLCVTQCAFSLLSLGIVVRILLGFFTAFMPEVGNLVMGVINYGVLIASSFAVLCLMAPKHWKWYSTPLNAMIVVVIFPWELMKKVSGAVGVVAFILLLGVYALLLAFGIR